ncbi:MAG: glycerol-3-phosphate 1-O-acyltransferase PlsY [Methylococcales bacterium]|jgi:acyl phosphate:glycerol-3-phosphate acyltransferase|nr:glycerol-3-phosphate 1-O-acyltransferase PlsY [Methylococcales bacterium]MBT7446055.1 glycerol-3-phosphate 1-O-acyltransferase PlsY [Methylococcales bacterium]
MLLTISIAIAGYLLGSISSAIITCKLMGLPDPRTQGSNNPGATNVMRIGGKKAAIITLLGDLLKGLIPVLLVHQFAPGVENLVAAGLGAFLGHLYPIFFRFQGGKGVATAIGVLLATHWTLGGAIVGTWLVMFGVFKISSLSALTAFLLAPLFAAWLLPWQHPTLTIGVAVITVLIFWRHQSNIKNLIKGEES